MKKLPYYRTIRTLKEFLTIAPNEIVQTKNYDLFETLDGNRGKENGYDEKRVRILVEKMTNGTFYQEMSVIMVNLSGISIDGRNRIEACRRTNSYVIFRVLFGEIYNTKDKLKLLVVVATYNATNPIWTAKELFDCAVIIKNPLAILLSELRAEFIANNIRLSEGDISVNQMMTLVARNKFKTHSTKTSLDAYLNADYLKYAKTSQFKDEFGFVCEIIGYFKDSPIDACRVLEQLLFLMWDDDKFNKNNFLLNLRIKGFKIDLDGTNGKGKGRLIRHKILELSKLRVKVLTPVI